ncbi:20905_t:CDS:2, partial [Gigaspora margarita]
VQITNLEREIKDLEHKSTRTEAEERLLVEKKKQLAELLKKQSNTNNNSKPGDKTVLAIGGGVVGIFALLLILILARNQSQEEYNTKEKRAEVKKLDVSEKDLEGHLDLRDFTNLKELSCNQNYLTSLDLGENKEVEELDLSDNNFFKQDLSFVSNLVKLKKLQLSNNFFNGSLKPLQKLTKLEQLDINNTDINSGLEYLPTGLTYFNCCNDYLLSNRPEAKATELYNKELHEKYPISERRKEIIKLNISNKELKGALKLKGFFKLKELDCRNNQLTNLDLTDCKGLSFLYCDNNELSNLNFLESVDKLEKLSVSSNKKFLHKSLADLIILKELRELNVSNCPLEGNLKHLKGLNRLINLNITNTNISEGLEYLPESCKKLYCNNEKLAEELDESKCSKEESETKYYDLDIEDKDGKTELSKLQSPEQFSQFKYLNGLEWASTATTVTGGALSLMDYATTGGVISLVAPLIGTDADTFLDNYNELRGILKVLESIEMSKWGKVNLSLKNLKDKAYQFLEEYDEDNNEEIDIEELIQERVKFSYELNKVEEIVGAMRGLEDTVTEYQKGELTGNDETKIEMETEEEKIEQPPVNQPILIKQKSSDLKIKLKKIQDNYLEIEQEFKRELKQKEKQKQSSTKSEELEVLSKKIYSLEEQLTKSEKKLDNLDIGKIYSLEEQLLEIKKSLLQYQVKNQACCEKKTKTGKGKEKEVILEQQVGEE